MLLISIRLFFFLFLLVGAVLHADWEENLQILVEKGNVPTWMERQIRTDFDKCDPKSFSIENVRQYEDMQFWIKDPMLIHVSIVGGKAEFHPFGEAKTSDRLFSVVGAIEKLCSVFSLPNMEFVVSLHDSLDWYLINSVNRLPFPIFVFARSSEVLQQILIPDWEIFAGYAHFLDELNRAFLSFPWSKRKNKAIWRGATTGGLYTQQNYRAQWRTQLIDQSLVCPRLIDARFSSVCQNEEGLERVIKSYVGSSMSVYDQLQYKYQILIDGNTCAFSRAYWQLFSNSVIFKQNSPHLQWYYGALHPYAHYIPFAHDSSDLAQKIEFAKKNDKLMKQIAANALNFAQNNLKREDVHLYLYLVMIEFAKKQAEASMYVQSDFQKSISVDSVL